MRLGVGAWLALGGMAILGAGIGALAQGSHPPGPNPTPIDAWLPWNGALGGGGMGLAGVMFYFYRQDRKASEEAYRQDRKASEDAMTKIAGEFRAIVEGNTRAITALKTVMEASDTED